MAAMAVVRGIAELRATVAGWHRAGESVGLVPTMGGLHDGHLALLRSSRAACARTVATLFVNPTQFSPGEDFATYPRDEAGDRRLAEAAGADLFYTPAVETMYPQGFATTVTVAGLTEQLCGPFRPGHFAGVATIVAKLLLQSGADAAFFGEKDFQQLQVIRRLVRDLDIPVDIVGVPTVREPDGLALSSRNRYLSPAERAVAGALHRLLGELAGLLSASSEAAPAIRRAREALVAAGFTQVDYVELCDAATLRPTPRATAGSRVFAAAWLGRTRLIDNVAVPSAPGDAVRSAG